MLTFDFSYAMWNIASPTNYWNVIPKLTYLSYIPKIHQTPKTHMQRWTFKPSFQIPQSLCLFFCKFNCCWKSHFLFIAPLITTTLCSHLLQQHLVSISASHHNGVCCQGKTMKTWKMQIVCKTNIMYLPVSNRSCHQSHRYNAWCNYKAATDKQNSNRSFCLEHGLAEL